MHGRVEPRLSLLFGLPDRFKVVCQLHGLGLRLQADLARDLALQAQGEGQRARDGGPQGVYVDGILSGGEEVEAPENKEKISKMGKKSKNENEKGRNSGRR